MCIGKRFPFSADLNGSYRCSQTRESIHSGRKERGRRANRGRKRAAPGRSLGVAIGFDPPDAFWLALGGGVEPCDRPWQVGDGTSLPPPVADSRTRAGGHCPASRKPLAAQQGGQRTSYTLRGGGRKKGGKEEKKERAAAQGIAPPEPARARWAQPPAGTHSRSRAVGSGPPRRSGHHAREILGKGGSTFGARRS